ncbi:MAG: FHA domain-containing protein [Planctomycetota bacterium]
MPNLTIREAGTETLFRIETDRATIGRAEHNDVAIRDLRASKDHCVIEQFGDRWKLVDLESHNGTRVNGALLNQAWLNHDDTIRIGEAELRFGLEGSARRAASTPPPPPPAARPAAAAASAQLPASGPADDEYDDLPPPRAPSRSMGEWMVILGGSALGVVLLLLFMFSKTSGLARDEHNERVLKQAEHLVSNGEWDAAIRYLEENADSDGTRYGAVKRRIKELEESKPGYNRVVRETEARKILSRVANKIRVYNSGTMIDTSEILRLMKKLKTDYAGTPQDSQAAQAFPEWYAGRVPDPESDLRRPLRKLQMEWEEACAKAEEYRKEEHFREARETLIRFVRVRESTASEVELEWLNTHLERQVANIDRLANTYFTSVERRVFNLVKNKRYDQAIQLYRKVIANYGIDKYVRKAKEAIADIEKKKRENK